SDVFAQVDPDNSSAWAPRQPIDHGVEPAAVEPHAVDDRLILFEAEQPGFRISRLRPGRHGPDLDKAEAEAPHRFGHAGILVVSGSEPDRVGEVETPKALRQYRRVGPLRPAIDHEPAQSDL